jgi:hypothetical protein
MYNDHMFHAAIKKNSHYCWKYPITKKNTIKIKKNIIMRSTKPSIVFVAGPENLFKRKR